MVNIRMKEHQRDVRLKSRNQHYDIETGYQILFNKTTTTIITITLYSQVSIGRL